MAEKIVTVKTWEEFKNAMNSTINRGDTLIISITADLVDTEQHALPTPSKNYWATIQTSGPSSDMAHLKILGNGHTISGINIPDTYTYTAILRYNPLTGGNLDINIYDLKFINIKTPSIRVYAEAPDGKYIHDVILTNCVITGVFDFYNTINELHQCNIVQMSSRTQQIWVSQSYYFITYGLYHTHYYYTHLNNITAGSHVPASVIDNSYVELNPGLTNLNKYTIIGSNEWLRTDFNQSCINCNNKEWNVTFSSNYNTAKGVTILNCTNDPTVIPDNLKNNIKIITDDQMKNADYLNSIGFTVTPTN